MLTVFDHSLAVQTDGRRRSFKVKTVSRLRYRYVRKRKPQAPMSPCTPKKSKYRECSEGEEDMILDDSDDEDWLNEDSSAPKEKAVDISSEL